MARAIEEITIVTNNYIRELIGLQELFKPLDRVHVEMIRRLVKQQNIRRGQQQTRETKPVLLTAREFLAFERPHVALETEALKNRFGIGGVFETTFVLEFVLQITVAFEDLFQIVSRVGHAVLELVHLMLDLLQATKCCERRLVNSRASLEVDVLVQQAQLHATRAHNLAAIGRFLTTDQTKDRALAGAVSTDQSDVFSGIYLQRRATEDVPSSVGLMNF